VLGPGSSFGEIALLRDAPRTATVSAAGAVRLLRLDRGPFLATVTGNRSSSDTANAVVGSRLGLTSV
jgi:CRP-like cAMP-binding protein